MFDFQVFYTAILSGILFPEPSLIAFLVLQILDVLTTSYALKKGGYEANPIMGFIFKKFGVWIGSLIGKTVTVIVAALSIGAGYSLIPFVVLYVAVVGWNLLQIRKLRNA